jgi:hypothetical protein
VVEPRWWSPMGGRAWVDTQIKSNQIKFPKVDKLILVILRQSLNIEFKTVTYLECSRTFDSVITTPSCFHFTTQLFITSSSRIHFTTQKSVITNFICNTYGVRVTKVEINTLKNVENARFDPIFV